MLPLPGLARVRAGKTDSIFPVNGDLESRFGTWEFHFAAEG